MVKEVDEVIHLTKKTLLDHPDLFSQELKRLIDNKIAELERVRTSNNSKHIAEIANALYEALEHPDQLKGHPEQVSQYREEVSRLRMNEILKKEALIYQKALSMRSIKVLFHQISSRLKGYRRLVEPRDAQDHRPFFRRFIDAWRARHASSARPTSSPTPHGLSDSHFPSGLRLLIHEVNGFVGWLVFFYVGYFVVANLSVEKQLSFLPQAFFLKTLQSPLIFAVSAFFVWLYVTLLILEFVFKGRWFSSLLFFLSSGSLLAFVMVNFLAV
ncbi:hypothetical protein IPJ72_03245 [Candidatus Peregrinibacteria bacterium]|nr:MAG: hypothetical protein IPJ72_03245 [Candidatus Peregrinibacteria bacterium]